MLKLRSMLLLLAALALAAPACNKAEEKKAQESQPEEKSPDKDSPDKAHVNKDGEEKSPEDPKKAAQKTADGEAPEGFLWSNEQAKLELTDPVSGAEMNEAKKDGWSTSKRVAAADSLLFEGDAAPVEEYALEAAPAPSSGPYGLKGTGRGGGGSSHGGFGVGSLGTAGKGSPSPRKKNKAKLEFKEDKRVVDDDSVRAVERPVVQALKAGTTDDNEDFSAYLKYIQNEAPRLGERVDQLDVSGRVYVQVQDRAGKPLPMARVSISSIGDKQIRWTAHTLGDGRAPFYPNLTIPGSKRAMGQGPWLLQTEYNGVYSTREWDGLGEEIVVNLEADQALASPIPVDVCFIIDTTGSMGDEIAAIKATLLQVTEKLKGLDRPIDLRYSAVLYRDITDEYITSTHPFVGDVETFSAALQEINAAGGGDGPESLNQGLAVAMSQLQWRDDAAKVAFLIADAEPHMDYQQDISYGQSAATAVHKGIRIHTVAASGLNDAGSAAFRQISQFTQGRFIFIEYGSDLAGSAADHGVGSNQVKTNNNLDQIFVNQISREVKEWGAK